MKIELCPCGSKSDYIGCCGRFIDTKQIPNTPEALMRSRYTAYTQANIDYIQATMCGRALKNFNPIEAKIWAEQAKWKRLKVIRAFEQFVEFCAYFISQGRLQKIHEVSEFVYIDGRWFYEGTQ